MGQHSRWGPAYELKAISCKLEFGMPLRSFSVSFSYSGLVVGLLMEAKRAGALLPQVLNGV